MSKEEKASLLVFIRNKYNLYVIVGTLCLLGYNIFKVAPDDLTPTKGGFYSYNLLLICFLVGIFIPISVGSFMGGYERSTNMLDYKLVSQSIMSWLKVQFTTMIKFFLLMLICASLLGGFLDLINHSNIGFYLYYALPRFLIIFFMWIFWGILSFLIALLLDSHAISFIVCSAFFYIEQYTHLTFGILWNQKSILRTLFKNDDLPFGIVQSSFHSFSFSMSYICILLILFIIVIIFYLKKTYPHK